MEQRRIRVLHVLPTGHAGGVETFALAVARGLDKQQFEFRACILGDDGPVAEELRGRGVSTAILHLESRPRPASALTLVRAIRGADIVHVNAGGSRLRRLAGLAGARVITHVHGPPDHWLPALRSGDMSLGRQIRRAFLANSDLVVAFSRYCQKMVIDQVPGTTVRVIPYGIEIGPQRSPATRQQARIQRGLPSEAGIIGFVGRLSPQKGIPELLECSRLVLERNSDAILVVLGNGPLRREIDQFANNYPGRVLVQGETPDARDWMAAFDLLVVPSEWEPLGIVAVEAMAAARPVVAFDVDGLPEVVIHEQSGVLVPAGDAPKLAQAACDLLADPKLAASMGASGRQRAEKYFSFHGMIDALEQLYRTEAGFPTNCPSILA